MAAAAIIAAGIVIAPRVLSSADGCSGDASLRVVADPTIAPALDQRARELTQAAGEFSAGGTCLSIKVTAADDGAGHQAIVDDQADVWIPRSLTWTTASVDPATVENLGSVATTPLTVVAPRDIASAMGWPNLEFSWTSVLSGEAGAVLTDPATSAEGRATLTAIRTAVGESADATQLAQVLTTVARNATATVDDALAVSTEAETPVFTAASEQSVVRHNAAGGRGVVALYPQEGTYAFDYPALLSTSSSLEQTVVEAFLDEMGSEQGATAIRAAGLRTPDGQAADSAGLVDGTNPAMPTLLPDPEPETVSEILRQWSALAIDMRMLSVIDVSGSMNETVAEGASRIELTRDAAKSALGLFPPTSSVGMWAFSIAQDPPNDYVELVSVGPLEEPIDGVSRLEALGAAADELPTRAQGGTGLYDTALAAFQHMRATYEPDKVNSVVLLTDGRNEDDPDGISLDVLLNTLRAQFDPARPVPIITIGMSSDADMEALRQISEATGTSAHLAEDPRDIEQVFLDAMVERQCRPNC